MKFYYNYSQANFTNNTQPVVIFEPINVNKIHVTQTYGL